MAVYIHRDMFVFPGCIGIDRYYMYGSLGKSMVRVLKDIGTFLNIKGTYIMRDVYNIGIGQFLVDSTF